MGRIVLEHYPAAKLPNDLRGDIALAAMVKVVVEEEADRSVPLSGNAVRDLLMRTRGKNRPVTSEEAVARIRALRDEWDD